MYQITPRSEKNFHMLKEDTTLIKLKNFSFSEIYLSSILCRKSEINYIGKVLKAGKQEGSGLYSVFLNFAFSLWLKVRRYFICTSCESLTTAAVVEDKTTVFIQSNTTSKQSTWFCHHWLSFPFKNTTETPMADFENNISTQHTWCWLCQCLLTLTAEFCFSNGFWLQYLATICTKWSWKGLASYQVLHDSCWSQC